MRKLDEMKELVSDLIAFYEIPIGIEERKQIDFIKSKLEEYGIKTNEKPFYRCLYLN